MGYVAPTPPSINAHDSSLQGIDAAQNEVNMEQMLRSANAASAPPLIRRSLERRAAASTNEADEETKVHVVSGQSPRLSVRLTNGVINWKVKLLVWFILSAAIAMSFFLQPGLSSVTHTGEPCVAPYVNLTGVNASNGDDTAEAQPPSTYAAGVALSMAMAIIIAVGLTIEKRAHMVAQAAGKTDGVGTFWFYVGFTLKNFVGEIGMLLAYGLAPASVVAPLGTVSVAANALLAVMFLGEPCRVRDWVALVGVAGGIVLIVLSVPQGSEQLTVHHLLSSHFYYSPRSYLYCVCLVPIITFVIMEIEPRFAKKYIVVWLFLCALISSITVAAARGFGSLITQLPSDCARAHCVHGVVHQPCSQTMLHWLFWILLVLIALTGVWSEYYRVLATNHFDNTQVLPVYQCFFTICSVLGGMLVYNEFQSVTPEAFIQFVAGCALSVGGVLVLLSGRRTGGHKSAAAPRATAPAPPPSEKVDEEVGLELGQHERHCDGRPPGKGLITSPERRSRE